MLFKSLYLGKTPPPNARVLDYRLLLLSVLAVVCFVFAGMISASSCWAADDVMSHHPPASKRSLQLQLTNPLWASRENLAICDQSCSFVSPSTRTHGVYLRDNYAPPRTDFSLSLGQTGPVSFEFTGQRLKMEVSF